MLPFYLQIREGFKGKTNIVFPSSIKNNYRMKSSQVSPSKVGDVWAAELQITGSSQPEITVNYSVQSLVKSNESVGIGLIYDLQVKRRHSVHHCLSVQLVVVVTYLLHDYKFIFWAIKYLQTRFIEINQSISLNFNGSVC